MAILASYLELFRPLIVTLVMVSSSFVLGSVVSYQYHLILLRLEPRNDPDIERTYRLLARRFYESGFIIGLVIVTAIDPLRSSPLYYLALGTIVFVFWVLWLGCAYSLMRTRIWELGVAWEWIVSSLALAFVSAFIGATFVAQWLQWMGWRHDPLSW